MVTPKNRIEMTKNNNNNKQYKKTAIYGLLFALIALVAINIIFSFLYFRIDLTHDKRNSLSPSTIELLESIEDKMIIKVYIEGDGLPADYQLFSEKIDDILQEFRRHSKNIYVEFLDPVAGKSKEEANAIYGEFYKKGLHPIPISSEDASGFSTYYVVPGANITYKGSELPATLAVSSQQGRYWLEYSIEELEYNLVATMRSLLNKHRPTVAFVDGHGELNPLSTSWAAFQLTRFYNVERVAIDGKINSLREIVVEDSTSQSVMSLGNKYDVLIIAQPTKAFSKMDQYVIDQHIMNGGRVLWLIDATNASIDSLQTNGEFFATDANLQLHSLFFKYGVRMNTNLVQDLSCLSVPIPDGYIGDQPQFKYWAFPYLVQAVNFTEHPIVKKMKGLKADFAGTIDFVGSEDNLKKVPLVTTSERTKVVPTPSIVSLNVVRSQPNMQEYKHKYLNLAVLVEGEFSSAFDGILPIEFDTIKAFDFKNKSEFTRQIFISDGDLIRNYFDKKSNQPYPTGYDYYTGQMYDNSDFILNCVNYLCSDDDLLDVRSKTLKLGTLSKTKIKKNGSFYAYVNLLAPLLVITLLGVAAMIYRKKKYSKKN